MISPRFRKLDETFKASPRMSGYLGLAPVLEIAEPTLGNKIEDFLTSPVFYPLVGCLFCVGFLGASLYS